MTCNLTNTRYLTTCPNFSSLLVLKKSLKQFHKMVSKRFDHGCLEIHKSHFIKKLREMQSSTWIRTNEISLTQVIIVKD